jgi:cytochrome c oxidase subunit III
VTTAAAQTEPILCHQFDDLGQQQDASTLGMWAFLATEIMFFGGLFTSYVVYRTLFPEAFAEGSRHLSITLGGINTAVLLGSSLTMALGVRAAQLGRLRPLLVLLALTMLLGSAFLGIKAVEYYNEFKEHLIPAINYAQVGGLARPMELFFVLYFIMTGLHAVHLIIGIVLVGVMAVLSWTRWLSGTGSLQIEVTGLYWHFIDIVWVFLYPLLYLIDAHK